MWYSVYTERGAVMEKKKVTTTLPPDLFREIKIQAAKENRTLSEIMEELISAYLKEKSNG